MRNILQRLRDHRVWPWLVIALVASAVCASLISAYLAVHTPDAVVEHRDASE